MVLALLGLLMFSVGCQQPQSVAPVGLESGIRALARAAPRETVAFTAMDLRGVARVSEIDGLLRKSPTLYGQYQVLQLASTTFPGDPLAQLAPDLEPAGAVVFLPGSGKERPLSMAFAVALSNPEAAAGRLSKAMGASTDDHGATLWHLRDITCCVYRNAYISGDGEAVARVLAAMRGQAPRLEDRPEFREALGRLPAEASFVDYQEPARMVQELDHLVGKDWARSQAFPEAREVMAATEYLVDGWWLEDGEFRARAFARPLRGTRVAAALLEVPACTATTARFFPAEWGNYLAVNLPWACRVAGDLESKDPNLPPDLSPQALASLTSGELGLAVGPSEPPGALSVQALEQAKAVGRLRACKSNLMALGRALDGWGSDHPGQFPARLEELVPGYLARVPSCPGAGNYAYRPGPGQRYRLYCQGTEHALAGQGLDHPALLSDRGLIVDPVPGLPPAPPEPGFLAAVGLRDPDGVTRMIDRLVQRHRATVIRDGVIGDCPVQGLADPPMRWMLVSQPPTLLVGFGSRARWMLEQAVAASGRSQADSPGYRKAAASDPDQRVALLIRTASTRPPLPGPAPLARTLAMLAGETSGTHTLTVEPDGLRYDGRGGEAPALVSTLFRGFTSASRSPGERATTPQLQGCKANLKNLGTALEMYAIDHGGAYPRRLDEVTPDLLKSVPECPAAGRDTYSESYQMAVRPDAYTLYCKGHHHDTPDYPSYTSRQGLCENPPRAGPEPGLRGPHHSPGRPEQRPERPQPRPSMAPARQSPRLHYDRNTNMPTKPTFGP